MVNVAWFTFRQKMDQGSEEALIRSARAGNREAFDQLLNRFDNELRRFIRRKVSAEEVEDLLQETWLNAWSSISWFEGRGRFRTWLYGIAVYKVKDHYRRRGRSLNEVSHEQLEDCKHHEVRFAGTELQESIRLLLEDLSPSQREVLELYYFADLTLSEIAQVLRRNLSTVKYQFYKAHSYVLEHAGQLEDWRLYEVAHMEAMG